MLKKIFPYLIIFLTVLILFIANYLPGTWLSGWDNLHPEFNFKLNLQREIFAGWQEYQGLGAVGGLMIAADIPRLLFLWLMSFFLPLSALRYVFTFLMLLLGGIGIKKLLRFLGNETAALSGALFYILNLGTVQIFYAPFDPFVVFFGFLPWLIYIFLNTLEKPDKKNLITFFIVNFLAIPQNYVPTIFVVYLIALSLIGIGYFFKNKTKQTIKRFFILFSLIFLINSFWLFNFFYFVKTNINSPSESHMGYMSTENIYLQNKKYGDLKNVIKLKSFLFDYADTDSSNKYVYMMTPWKNYIDKKPIEIILVTEFLVIILGIIYSFREKNKYWPSFFLLFIFSFIILANNTPIISLANDFLRNIPFFSQVFRVPFTKFGNLAIFSYSIFFAFGIAFLHGKLSKFKLEKLVIPLLIVSLVLTTLPAFFGNLIYEKLKIKIPQEYFELMNFFDKEPLGKIALFPQPSYWNWNYYSWGYVGTGFLWYGVKQPTLDRAFDGYSNINENYYWELSQAVYSKNLSLFEKILSKYQINWLVLDNNIVTNPSPKTLFNDQLKALISQSTKINYLTGFGKLEIYEVPSIPKNNFISINNNLITISPKYNWNNYDKAFEDHGDYLSSEKPEEAQIFYPFRSLFTGKKQENQEFSLEENDDYYIFKTQIPKEFSKAFIPKADDLEITEYNKNDLSKTKKLPPQVYFDETSYILSVYVPKIRGLYSYDSKTDNNFFTHQAQTCNSFTSNKYSLENIVENDQNKILLNSQDGSSCLTTNLPNLTHQLGYLISIKAKNIEGKSLLLNLINNNSKRKDIDTYLSKNNNLPTSFFVQPPMENDGLGYSLILDSISIGNMVSRNSIEEISINPIPYRFLTSIKFTKTDILNELKGKLITSLAIHNNIGFYQVELEQVNNDSIIYLSQSYNPGWIAFTNGKILDHVLVNDWANGWKIDGQTSKVTIIFWPQYLEFLGFALLAITFLSILLIKEKHE
ncbi:conserved membrane hypothetical protein [Candidatus Roizmanbacteria bacterium]|nr:conserved membrane hypothetical protein [Candidatus Roizmanbacteria bacterium]